MKNVNANMQTKEDYISSMHRLGRMGAIMSVLIMLGIPTVIAIVYDTFPGFKLILAGSAGLLAIFVPIAISEVVSYTPILGSSIYLTLVTGNVTNLKIPVATNAMGMLDVKYGTEEADVVSAIAVSASAITTVIIVAIGVVLLVPLEPFLSKPEVVLATGYMLPALFGALILSVFSKNIGGGIQAEGRLKAIILPVVIMTILCAWNLDVVTSIQGILIILLIPLTYFGSKWLYKKGGIKVTTAKEREGK